jgi:hypothetical protein
MNGRMEHRFKELTLLVFRTKSRAMGKRALQALHLTKKLVSVRKLWRSLPEIA